MLNVTRLLVRRGTSAAGVLVAAVVAATTAAAMLVGFTSLTPRVAADAFRDVLDSAPPEDLRIEVRSALRTEGWPDTDAEVRRLAEEQGERVPLAVSAAGWSSVYTLPGQEEGLRVQAGFVEDAAGRARLLAGRWPQPGADPIEVAVHADALPRLGVEVGDELTLVPVGREQVIALTVVGALLPLDGDEAGWGGLGGGVLSGEGLTFTLAGPVILERDDFLTRVPLRAGSALWSLEPDLSGVDSATAPAVRQGIETLKRDVRELLSYQRDRTEIYTRDSLGSVLHRAEVASQTTGSLLGAVTLPIAVLAAVALWFTVRLVAMQRAATTALLRARGTSTFRLLGWSIGGAAVPAVLVAAGGIGATVLLAGDGLSAPAALSGWWMAVAVAGAWAVLLAIGEVRAAPSVAAVQRRQSRPGLSLVRRAGVDVIPILLGLVALQQLYRPQPTAPVLTVGPAFVVLAAAMVTLRLLPYLARVWAARVTRSRSLGGPLAAREVSRRSGGHLASALLVVLALSVAMLAATTLSTWEQQRQDAIDFAEPADWRVAVARDAVALAPVVAQRLEQIPGVAAVTPVWRWTTDVPAIDSDADILGVDAASAAQVMRWRPDLAGDPVPEVMARLTEKSSKQSLAAVFTSALADHLNVARGNSVNLGVNSVAVQVTVVEIVEAIPGVDNRVAALVDGADLASQLAHLRDLEIGQPGASGSKPPDEWWLAVGDSAAEVETWLVDAGFEVRGRNAGDLAFAADDRVVAGIGGGLTSGLWAASVLVIIGTGAHTVSRMQERRGETALLRALGVSRREATRGVLVEQSLALGFAALTGIAAGLGVAALVVPTVVAGLAGLPDLPPVRLVLPWPVIAAAIIAVVLVIAVLTGLHAAWSRRHSVADTLREGDQR